MKNKELFKRTLDILVKAYQNDTLEHGSCTACAVGNIVAANMEIKISTLGHTLMWDNWMPYWQKLLSTVRKQKGIDSSIIILRENEEFIQGQLNLNSSQLKEPMQQILSTGYTFKELAEIEWAFETADEGNNKDDYMFNGLLAVYDVLCKIHEVEEPVKGELVFIKS